MVRGCMSGSVEMMDKDFARRRRGRSIALFLALAGVALLFYAMAIVKFATQTVHIVH